MSRYHMIDAVEGKSYVNVQGFPSPSSPSPSPSPSPSSASPRFDDYSTGRGDPLFPDIDMHLGMIFGMNSGNGTAKGLIENSQPPDFERLRLRLKFLEDSNTVMQSRNQNLITENKAISNQLEEEAKIVQEIKLRLQETQAELEKERSKSQKSTCSESKDKIISTTGLAVQLKEKSTQCWAVCLACQRKLEGNEAPEPTVTITKNIEKARRRFLKRFDRLSRSELESLENDMQALRDAVVAREEAWDKAMEREENYRQQLARLTAETVTSRHLSDSRHSELETLTFTLTEKEAELKATQKDLLSLKKIIVKMERRQRDLEEAFDVGNAEMSLNLMSEKEQKTVEEIVRRQVSIKPKQRPRPRGTSSMPQSLQTTPRSSRTKEAVVPAGSSTF